MPFNGGILGIGHEWSRSLEGKTKTFCNVRYVMSFEEAEKFEALISSPWSLPWEVKSLCEITSQGKTYHQKALVLGSTAPTAACFGLFAGVHGLERVGTHCALAFLNSLKEQLRWDKNLQERFKNFRLITVPIINPTGIANLTRSNHNGVDLMRNSPVEAEEKPHWLAGGHKYSPKLPWYRGESMEPELKSVVQFVKEQAFDSPMFLSLDLHSGFGWQDRIWCPYAKSRRTFPFYDQFKELEKRFSESFPYHIYQFEKQSDSYLTHGDLWDYLLDSFPPRQVYLPLTLEMGSWLWIKKNPWQIFNRAGIFNPILPHRYARIMRRHQPFFDFLMRFIQSGNLTTI